MGLNGFSGDPPFHQKGIEGNCLEDKGPLMITVCL